MTDTLTDRLARYEGDNAMCFKCGWTGKASDLTQPHNQHPECSYSAYVIPAHPTTLALCAAVKAATDVVDADRSALNGPLASILRAALAALYDALGEETR